MSQSFTTTDLVRLEVETDPTGLVNMIQNPSGDLGSWGWLTPLANSLIYRDFWASDWAMYYSAPGGGPSYFYSEAMPIAAGQYAAASWHIEASGVAGYYKVKFEWLDSSKVLLSSSTQTAYLNSTGVTVPYGPYQAPASTAYVRLRFDHFANTSGGNPGAGDWIVFREATVAKAATSAELGSIRYNLIPNPSFEVDASGWEAVANTGATIARSTAQSSIGAASLLYTSGGVGYYGPRTLSGKRGFPVTGGGSYSAQIVSRASTTTRGFNVGINWYNAAGSGIGGTGSGYVTNTTTSWTPQTVTGTAPASAVTGQLYVLFQGTPPVGEQHYFDVVMVERDTVDPPYFDGDTTDAGGIDYGWNTHAPVVTNSRTNLIKNPSFETNSTGWVQSGQFPSGTVSRTTTQFSVGTASLASTANTSTWGLGAMTSIGTAGIPVVPGEYYFAQASVRLTNNFTADNAVKIWFRYYDSTGAYLTANSMGLLSDVALNSWVTVYSNGSAVPSGAAFVSVEVWAEKSSGGNFTSNTAMYIDGVLLEKRPSSLSFTSAQGYFDGSTADSTSNYTVYDRSWTGTAHASTSTEVATTTLPYSTATSSNLAYIEPIPYLNILQECVSIQTTREAMNVGTLTAEVVSTALDPSQSNLIRPGRRCRLMALDGDTWSPIFTGKVSEASVTYDLKDPSVPASKRARVVIAAVDATAQLANQKRSEGVGTVDELPYVLEGCGVPWNCGDTGGDQVASATVVAYNDNASAVDQIAITRDSDQRSIAWVSRYGVVNVVKSTAGSGESFSVGTDQYSDIDISYNTQDCINEVTVNFLRYNPSTGQTETVPYGPYRDEASIAEWGVRSATYTIQGIAEETADLQAFANAVLTANATPRVTVNTLTVPIDEAAKVGYFALRDPYSDVTVAMPDAGSDTLTATRIDNTITPYKWMMRLTFSDTGTVASPQFTPSPSGGAGGKTIGQLLRPVGEVTMWFGAKLDCPSGWLVLDGTTFSSTDYPDLATLLGGTTLPDFTDRFPIGAGTKALGTLGGAATHTLATGNLPSHTHGAGTLVTSSAGSHNHNLPRGTSTGSSSGRTAPGNTTADDINTGSAGAHTHDITGSTGSAGSGTAVDHMNPWRALWFVIRAK